MCSILVNLPFLLMSLHLIGKMRGHWYLDKGYRKLLYRSMAFVRCCFLVEYIFNFFSCFFFPNWVFLSILFYLASQWNEDLCKSSVFTISSRIGRWVFCCWYWWDNVVDKLLLLIVLLPMLCHLIFSVYAESGFICLTQSSVFVLIICRALLWYNLFVQ